MFCCQFVPNNILKNLDTDIIPKEDQELDEFIREYRKFLQENREVKETILELQGLKKYRKVTHKEVRRLFDSGNRYRYTTTPTHTDEQIHSRAVSTKGHALELANVCYDFFHNKFNLESYDNKNTPVDVHINFGDKYNNAFWDGLRMVFGNGDGYYFNSFQTQNIFTHEFTHAVTENLCGLLYENQSGALNEHMSDVFAVCLDQNIRKQKPSEASWLIGEGLFTSRINAKALRTFKNEPAYNDKLLGKDPQPKHMDNYKNLANTEEGDYGGVHINSGIPNRAFYEFCMLAEKEKGSEEMINRSYKAPMQIWFRTYKRIKPTQTFKEFVSDTISVTKLIHPQLEEQIKKAWSIVGL
jgi:Zn-dependent metalloprotease